MYGQSGKSKESQGILHAGIAKIDITPDFPVMLYGYASRKTPSEGIHDHLYARAVVFKNGTRKFVLVSTDIGSFTDTLYSAIKKSIMEKFDLKDSEFFIAAIHSHSSPVVSLDNTRMNIEQISEAYAVIKTIKRIGEAYTVIKTIEKLEESFVAKKNT